MNNEYRCTRDALYPAGTVGHSDLSAREGHYITAKNPQMALMLMALRFPGEESFTIQPWNKNSK